MSALPPLLFILGLYAGWACSPRRERDMMRFVLRQHTYVAGAVLVAVLYLLSGVEFVTN